MAPTTALQPVLTIDDVLSSSASSVDSPSPSCSSSVCSSSSSSSSASTDMSSFEKKTKKNVKIILEQLNDDEIEYAACTSYEYQLFKKENNNKTQQEHQTKRKMYAKEMIERYVLSKSDSKIACQRLKDTIQFRKEMNLHDLDSYTKQNQEELELFFNDCKTYTQGYDIDGRSTLLFTPRLVSDHNQYKRTIIGHVWNIEKAIACTKSIDHTINVIVDFNLFSIYRHSPPYKVGKELMTILRKHYVGHVHKIFLCNVPTTFTILWNIFSSCAGTKTKEKIIFVNTNDPTNVLLQYYQPSQSTSWMIPKNGCKNRQLNVNEYVNHIPFDETFDQTLKESSL